METSAISLALVSASFLLETWFLARPNVRDKARQNAWIPPVRPALPDGSLDMGS